MDVAKKEFVLWWVKLVRLNALRLTRVLAHRFSERLGFVYVCGYPKSGTTWMSQMVAQYMDIPYIEKYYLPQTFEGLVHNHWGYHPALDHSVHVIRDGRDVMVSTYMNQVKGYILRRDELARLGRTSPARLAVESSGQYARVRRRFLHLFGEKFDPWDVKPNLARFIEAELHDPVIPAVRQPWQEYIRDWREQAKNTVFIKYEDLLLDCEIALARTLERFLNTPVDRSDIAYAVQRYAFKRQTGRTAGTEDRQSFARKGVQGDWKNHFTREASDVFHQHAGDLLIDLGYEEDNRWMESFQA